MQTVGVMGTDDSVLHCWQILRKDFSGTSEEGIVKGRASFCKAHPMTASFASFSVQSEKDEKQNQMLF